MENQLVFNRAQMCYTDTILKKKQGDLPMAIKCVALDLDGTTLDRQGKLSPANRQAIEAAIAQGVHVVIASGRSYDTLPKKVLSIPASSGPSPATARRCTGYPKGRCAAAIP